MQSARFFLVSDLLHNGSHTEYIQIVRSWGESPRNGLGLHPRRDSFYYTRGVVTTIWRRTKAYKRETLRSPITLKKRLMEILTPLYTQVNVDSVPLLLF